MDGYATKLLVVGGVLLAVVFLWVIWKFFFGMIKHAVIILLLGGAFAGAYYFFRTPSSPAKNPAIGKHAYLTESGKYLGVVEGEGDDARRGPVWNIRFPGDHPKMYGKSRVTLKDKRDPASEPTPSPTATPAPMPAAKPKAASGNKQ